MATVDQRVSYIEGRFESLATKADLADLKAGLRGDLNRVIFGVASLQFLGLDAVAAIIRFLG